MHHPTVIIFTSNFTILNSFCLECLLLARDISRKYINKVKIFSNSMQQSQARKVCNEAI